MSPLPYPQSLAAHEALRAHLTLWTLAEQAFSAAPTPDNAKAADVAGLAVVAHAINCGCTLAEPHIMGWAKRRVGHFNASVSAPSDYMAIVGGEGR